jgi:hypothetical protein
MSDTTTSTPTTKQPKYRTELPAEGLRILAGAVLDVAARLGDRLPGPPPHAAPIITWCVRDDVPHDLVKTAIAVGKGPAVYRIGKHYYCSYVAWCAWHDALAEAGGLHLPGRP